MKTALSVFILLFSFNLVLGQHPSFENGYGIASDGQQSTLLCKTNDDGLLLVSNFKDSVQLDSGSSSISVSSSGSHDFFIQHRRSNGIVNWVYGLGGTGIDLAHDIVVDSQGNIYLTGSFSGTVDFDISSSTNTLTSVGSGDAFVLKLDSNGNYLWAKQFGSSSFVGGTAIALDDSGYVLCTGEFKGTTDFNPGSSTFNLSTSPGGAPPSDIFIVKLNNLGGFVWAKSLEGGYFEHVFSIVCDSHNDVYLGGYFGGTVDFDPDTGVSNKSSIPNQYKENGFILKLNENGDFQWVKDLSATHCTVRDLTFDTKNVLHATGEYVSSLYINSTNINPYGEEDIFVLKLDTSGTVLSLIGMGSTSGVDYGSGITVDDQGNQFITGAYNYTVDFDPDTSQFFATVPSTYGYFVTDVFILKLDSTNEFQWVATLGEIEIDFGRDIVLANDRVYTVGMASGDYSYGTFDFNHGPGVKIDTIGYENVFFHCIKDCAPSFGFDTLTACGEYIDGNGISYTSDTSFVQVIDTVAANGCDSIITVTIEILDVASSVDSQFACNSYLWVDGNTYSGSTDTPTYVYSGGGNNGCDSIVRLFLEIGEPVSYIDSLLACDSLQWVNGITYYSSTDTPSMVYPGGASNGCDSTVTLHLVIGQVTNAIDNVVSCDSFTWQNGITYYQSTDTPTIILTSTSTGCDSTISLNLTINHSVNSIDSFTICNAYTWLDGITYYSDTTGPTFNFTGASSTGCDSIVTLDLVVDNVSDVSVSQIDSLLSANLALNTDYQWLDCDSNMKRINGAIGRSYIATKNGQYAVELTQNGCVDTSVCVVVSTLDITELTEGINVTLFPNPTAGKLTLELTEFVKDVEIEIYSVDGRKVVFGQQINFNSFELEISEPSGVYYLHLKTSRGSKVIPFIVEME